MIRLTSRRVHILECLRENADGGDPYMGDVGLVELQLLSEHGLARHATEAERATLKRPWTITDDGRDALVRAVRRTA